MRRNNATVTYILIALNVIIYVFMTVSGHFEQIEAAGAMYVPAVLYDHQWYRVITSMFLHADFRHIANNMIMLLVVGYSIEERFGHIKYLVCYFIGGIGATALSSWWEMHLNNYSLGVGASGAIMCVFAIMVVMNIKDRSNFDKTVGIRMLLVLALMVFGNMGPGINWMAHLGGAICGLIFGVLLYRKKHYMTD